MDTTRYQLELRSKIFFFFIKSIFMFTYDVRSPRYSRVLHTFNTTHYNINTLYLHCNVKKNIVSILVFRQKNELNKK